MTKTNLYMKQSIKNIIIMRHKKLEKNIPVKLFNP
jgi:hypothetical protein